VVRSQSAAEESVRAICEQSLIAMKRFITIIVCLVAYTFSGCSSAEYDRTGRTASGSGSMMGPSGTVTAR
jgi:hypothetical protein